jgi:hypothetical protein
MSVPAGLIPPEVLAILQDECSNQFDTFINWWPQTGGFNEVGQPILTTPVVLPARITYIDREFYNEQGMQTVPERCYYIPFDSDVQTEDTIAVQSELPTPRQLVTTIDIMPSPFNPVLKRLHVGAAR